jgi:hypothetical protein
MNDLEYLEHQGLNQFIDLSVKHSSNEDPFAGVRTSAEAAPMAPEIPDLARLHRLIRERKVFTVLEFGVGYSTLVIADALEKNRLDWAALPRAPELRNRFLFQCFSVDTSPKWLQQVADRMPAHLRTRMTFHHSTVRIGTHAGQLCHFYDNLPDIVPDFVYLDGPSPKDVEGTVNGLSFQCDERTVMSGDLLLMEPTLLPGTFVLVDGRTNNCRFLARNFRRDFKMTWDRDGDVTTFELVEERLGPFNILGSDAFR